MICSEWHVDARRAQHTRAMILTFDVNNEYRRDDWIRNGGLGLNIEGGAYSVTCLLSIDVEMIPINESAFFFFHFQSIKPMA